MSFWDSVTHDVSSGWHAMAHQLHTLWSGTPQDQAQHHIGYGKLGLLAGAALMPGGGEEVASEAAIPAEEAATTGSHYGIPAEAWKPPGFLQEAGTPDDPFIKGMWKVDQERFGGDSSEAAWQRYREWKAGGGKGVIGGDPRAAENQAAVFKATQLLGGMREGSPVEPGTDLSTIPGPSTMQVPARVTSAETGWTSPTIGAAPTLQSQLEEAVASSSSRQPFGLLEAPPPEPSGRVAVDPFSGQQLSDVAQEAMYRQGKMSAFPRWMAGLGDKAELAGFPRLANAIDSPWNPLTHPLLMGIGGLPIAGGILSKELGPKGTAKKTDQAPDPLAGLMGAPSADPSAGGGGSLLDQLTAPPSAMMQFGGYNPQALAQADKAISGQMQGLPGQVAALTGGTDKALAGDYGQMNPSMVPLMKAGQSMISGAAATDAKLLQSADAMLPQMLAALQGAKTMYGAGTKGTAEYGRMVSEAKQRVTAAVHQGYTPQEAAQLVSDAWSRNYGIFIDPLDIEAGFPSSSSGTKNAWMEGISAERAASMTAHHREGLSKNPKLPTYINYVKQYKQAGGSMTREDFLSWLVQAHAASNALTATKSQQDIMNDDQVVSLALAIAGIDQ